MPGLIGYHADNCAKNLNISPEDLTRLSGTKVAATSTIRVLEEFLRAHPNLSCGFPGRLVFRKS